MAAALFELFLLKELVGHGEIVAHLVNQLSGGEWGGRDELVGGRGGSEVWVGGVRDGRKR